MTSSRCFSPRCYFVLRVYHSFLQNAEVGHDDEGSEASDWLTPLRYAQKTASDWLGVVLASFLGLALAPLLASTLTEGLYTEGAMLMSGFL